MRERLDLISGSIEFLPGNARGALVRATVPYTLSETHAGN